MNTYQLWSVGRSKENKYTLVIVEEDWHPWVIVLKNVFWYRLQQGFMMGDINVGYVLEILSQRGWMWEITRSLWRFETFHAWTFCEGKTSIHGFILAWGVLLVMKYFERIDYY